MAGEEGKNSLLDYYIRSKSLPIPVTLWRGMLFLVTFMLLNNTKHNPPHPTPKKKKNERKKIKEKEATYTHNTHMHTTCPCIKEILRNPPFIKNRLLTSKYATGIEACSSVKLDEIEAPPVHVCALFVCSRLCVMFSYNHGYGYA